jgi:hypothetical protein
VRRGGGGLPAGLPAPVGEAVPPLIGPSGMTARDVATARSVRVSADVRLFG